MFRRQPLFGLGLMCSTHYSLNSPALRCGGNAFPFPIKTRTPAARPLFKKRAGCRRALYNYGTLCGRRRDVSPPA